MTLSKLLSFAIAFFAVKYAQSFYLNYDVNLQLAVNTPSFVHLYGSGEMSSLGVGNYVGFMYELKKRTSKKHISSDIIGVEGAFASKKSKLIESDFSFITYTKAYNVYYMMNISKLDAYSFYFKIGGGLVSLKTYDNTKPTTLVFTLDRPFVKAGFFVFIESYNEVLLFPVGFDVYVFENKRYTIKPNIFEIRAGFVYRIYSKQNNCVYK